MASRLKCDQLGPWADFFSRLYCVVPSASRSSSRRSSPARWTAPIRSWMPAQIEAFTSPRTFEAITSKVENAGSSSPASTTFSSAMLIRSAGRFFAAASLRIDCSAILRASAWS
ncbi:hypothetical protein [Actinacidiphila sp. bgisy160]|uniref:hypothetical protein n=1 Tax=Actinacidiphila sp. bgisy160 TaxID=3413796 RepID=UPI003D7602DD